MAVRRHTCGVADPAEHPPAEQRKAEKGRGPADQLPAVRGRAWPEGYRATTGECQQRDTVSRPGESSSYLCTVLLSDPFDEGALFPLVRQSFICCAQRRPSSTPVVVVEFSVKVGGAPPTRAAGSGAGAPSVVGVKIGNPPAAVVFC